MRSPDFLLRVWQAYVLCHSKMALELRYAASVRYIFSNADFSSAAKRYQHPQENWKRFDSLLEKLGRPLRRLKVVHIAGTNGKGTTSALCEAMLRASGMKVGLFTSPHLHSFRERIRLDGQLVSKEAVVAAVDEIRPAIEAIGDASPFEKLSALALVCFNNANMEWAVLETGLGGRWDCTNHCEPAVCGITRVGLDHMNVLGNTVAEIAGEKAGIIKACAPVFAVPQEPEALSVLQASAAAASTELEVVTDSEPPDLPFWLCPAHQRLNAALAMAMVQSLASRGLLQEQPSTWRAACDGAMWPARFEILRPKLVAGGGAQGCSPLLVIDVAHNEPAIAALLRAVAATWPQAPLAIVFGANRDKDVASIARLFAAQPRLRQGVAVLSTHPKATTAHELVRVCVDAASKHAEAGDAPANTSWCSASSMTEALRLAASSLQGGQAKRPREGEGGCDVEVDSGVVLCCGSVFVASDMRAAIAQEEPQLFAPSDWVHEHCGEPALLM